MQNILKCYYDIPIEMDYPGYFIYHKKQYYIGYINNIASFYNTYHHYRYLMHLCHLTGYVVIPNNQNQWFTQNYVLLEYISEFFSYNTYLNCSLTPLQLPKIAVSEIKEQWIGTINNIFEKVNVYDENQKALIYYYLGMSENSINILNYLLQIDSRASIPLCLSLTFPIDNDICELLNTCHYMISSRIRHLLMLIQSGLLYPKLLQNIFAKQFYDVYEIIYVYAHILYPGYFFEHVIKEKDIAKFYKNIHKEKELIKDIYQVLSLYVSLPKIHWINGENML
ncbi:MAG: hypothetical protein LUF02_00620 [Erysipelotrichaceae bacterium]|nr:hypothetical protein [Erysipelotrichaceae bacterium]